MCTRSDQRNKRKIAVFHLNWIKTKTENRQKYNFLIVKKFLSSSLVISLRVHAGLLSAARCVWIFFASSTHFVVYLCAAWIELTQNLIAMKVGECQRAGRDGGGAAEVEIKISNFKLSSFRISLSLGRFVWTLAPVLCAATNHTQKNIIF